METLRTQTQCSKPRSLSTMPRKKLHPSQSAQRSTQSGKVHRFDNVLKVVLGTILIPTASVTHAMPRIIYALNASLKMPSATAVAFEDISRQHAERTITLNVLGTRLLSAVESNLVLITFASRRYLHRQMLSS